MKSPPKIHMNEWAEALRCAQAMGADEVPEGWKPLYEIAGELGYTETHIRHQLNHLLGKTVERKKFRIILPTGSIRTVFHYRKIK